MIQLHYRAAVDPVCHRGARPIRVNFYRRVDPAGTQQFSYHRERCDGASAEASVLNPWSIPGKR
ncbi:MAG: hypothetical protein OES38_19920 [Gammaproteobacteria bacterium]|nr:hypothetical protein [Gammaproteobacteria bacterium]